MTFTEQLNALIGGAGYEEMMTPDRQNHTNATHVLDVLLAAARQEFDDADLDGTFEEYVAMK